MARIKQRVYTKSKERTMQSMLEVCEHTLSELGMEIRTQYLDKTLIEVQGTPPKGSPLGKKNVITVYKEGDKIFIKLTYDMKDPDRFWDVFENNLAIYGANVEEIEEKSMIVRQICETIRRMGGNIDPEEAWDFLYHYEKNQKKLPDEDEIDNISIDYIKMKDELTDEIPDEEVFVEDTVGEESESEEDEVLVDEESGVVVTRTEALMAMIDEIPTLDEETKNYYQSLFDQLVVEDQERLVKKVQAIENDLDKVPYLLPENRKELRNKVMKMDKKKRRKTLSKEIKTRQKNQEEYMADYIREKVRQNLEKLPNVDESDIADIQNVILTWPFDRKERIAEIVQEIDQKIEDTINEHSIQMTEPEKKNLRIDLLRLGRKEAEKRLEELVKDYKTNMVENILFEEIPQLRFEDNEKIIKEMIWLSKEEIQSRVEQLKQEYEKKTKKRSEVFEKTDAGTACPKCGWPMGKFSKKCPRCGYNTDDDWFDL